MISEFCTLLMTASVLLIVCDVIDFVIGRFAKAPHVKRPGASLIKVPNTQARIIGIIGRDSEADSIVDSVLSRASFDDGESTAERVTDRILARHGF